MLKKFFKNKDKENPEDKNVLILALLIHAAKIDEKYTDAERNIIKRTAISLLSTTSDQVDEIIKKAEKKEEDSNQIVEFTKEIKKYPMEFRLKIIEIVWKIVYSDGNSDSFESNLIRRICGVLYVSDKDNGIIKLKIQNLFNKI